MRGKLGEKGENLKEKWRISEEFYLYEELVDKTKNTPS